eukprot:NODE_1131_length_996_cov_16.225547_g1086_i0.p1 GENE.NODE_1131_length_996_cov_16.225547_g1086_i0~~NODE_1131_length_996_cov_16.225547_g1086_i0.p1  ORF type:complete len:237 (-),score=19.43 NODE_1131_length_996_cov_16.225547_g1086_i0:192-902(-)
MIKFEVIDSFTKVPFTGNPAAVVLWDKDTAPSEIQMQRIAREMNLSETAFLRQIDQTDNEYTLRWFTPTKEVDLCGHATLASAHFLYTTMNVDSKKPLKFHSKSGILITNRNEDGSIEMEFPALPAKEVPAPEFLLESLQLSQGEVLYIGYNDMDYIVEVKDMETVHSLTPNFGLMVSFSFICSLAIETLKTVKKLFFSRNKLNQDDVSLSLVVGMIYMIVCLVFLLHISESTRTQ